MVLLALWEGLTETERRKERWTHTGPATCD